MRVLLIGGTGNISRACTSVMLEQGMDVYHLNRGTRSRLVPRAVHTLTADIGAVDEVRQVLGTLEFDCVVDFICYRPEEARRSIRLFQGRTAQFIFISSASAYRKPPTSHIITESTPLSNPFWDYSRAKIECEAVFREAYANSSFPVTIVRPSHTYDDGWVPTTFSSRDFTVPQRILDGRPIVIHGDGQSLWTLTHSRDFASGLAGLAGNPATYGEAFHITSDEAMTWEAIHGTIAEALSRTLNAVHIPSNLIAQVLPKRGDGLLGDKMYSTTFDNAKLKRFVPGFQARIPFHRGVRQSLSYLRAHPDALSVDPQLDRDMDLLLARWNAMR